MTERRTVIAPAGDTVVAVQRQQCRILPPGDLGGEQCEVLRPRALINNEHVTRHISLCQRRVNCRDCLLSAIE
jgi:hypothetical protein